MTNHLERSTPLSIFNIGMTEEYRSVVVKRCLEHLGQVSPPARRCLQVALRKHIKLPGFSDPNQALKSPKRSLLLSEVISASHRSDALMGALLRVWKESHPELQQAVLTFLQSSEDPVDEPATVGAEFPRIWSQAHMLSVAADFVQAQPTFDRDDAALMMCYVYGRAPIPDELLSSYGLAVGSEDPQSDGAQDMQPNESPQASGITTSPDGFTVPITATLLQDMLAQLQALPPDALEWEQVSSFAASLEALKDSKLLQREHGRIQLREALATLPCEVTSSLAWWGYEVTNWSADHCAWTQAGVLAQEVLEWQAALLRHEKLRQPSSRAEDLARRPARESLEVEIERAYSELSILLGPDGPEPIPPSDAGATVPLVPSRQTADAEVIEAESSPIADLTDSNMTEAADLLDQITSPAETYLTVASEEAAGETDAPEQMLTDEAEILDITSDRDAEELAPEPLIAEEPIFPAATDTLSEDLPQVGTAPGIKWSDGEEKAFEADAMTDRHALQLTPAVDVAALLGAVSDEKPDVPPTTVEHDTDEAWQTMLCQMLAEDDLMGAYWLTRSLDAVGRAMPAPDWLLAAALGARCVTADTPILARDLRAVTFHPKTRRHTGS